MGGSVAWGLVEGAFCGVARFHCDWRVERPVASCAVGIGTEGVVWVALCRDDWWGGRRVGGAASL